MTAKEFEFILQEGESYFTEFKENFGKKAVRRNQLIASLLQRCNIVENMGTGINKIKQLLKENKNFPPEFIFNSFYTILFRRKNEGVNLLLATIKKYPGKRSSFFSKKLNTSVKNIERWLKKLRDEEKIVFIGAPKTGGYFLKEGKKQ